MSTTVRLSLASTDADGDGKLRVDEFASNVGNLRPELEDVQAQLKIELTSDLLDYIDADGKPDNNTVHGGDPFQFAATTSLDVALNTTTGAQFTWNGIDIINPDIDQDGQNDFTSAVLVEDMRQLALDVIRGNRTILSGDLAAGFNAITAPLTQNGLGDVLGTARGLAEFLLTNTEVLHVVEFDTIEDFLNHGLPAQPQDVIRLRIDLGNIALQALDNPSVDFSALLPGAGDVSGRVHIDNARLFGALVFGFDTSSNPFYLLTAPDAIRPDAVTTVGAGFDLVADLSDISLLNGALTLNGASATLSPTVHVTFPDGPGGSDGKLRIGNAPTGIAVSLDQPLLLTVTADSAALFPALAVNVAVIDDNPGDTLPGLFGQIDLTTGHTTLDGRKATASLGSVLNLVATGVHLTVDPHAPGNDDLLRIDDAFFSLDALAANGLVPTLDFTSFGLRQNGKLFIAGAQLRAPPGYSNALGIAGLLPLELDVLRIDFPNPDDLNTFTVGATGHFLIDELAGLLPFTPVLYIGDPAGIGTGGVTTVTPGSSNGASILISMFNRYATASLRHATSGRSRSASRGFRSSMFVSTGKSLLADIRMESSTTASTVS